MKKYSKILNEETKEISIFLGTDINWAISQGYEEIEVEQAYDGSWYVKGYVPEKPQVIINKEKVDEAHKYLEETDYAVIKIAEGVATKEDYADVLVKREEARELIRSLENKE